MQQTPVSVLLKPKTRHLYRALLRVAERVGREAQRLSLPAGPFIRRINAELSAENQLPPPVTSFATPASWRQLVRDAFTRNRRLRDPDDLVVATEDGFAALKLLSSLAKALRRMPRGPFSRTRTRDVVVEVRSRYLGRDISRHLFGYQVRVRNESTNRSYRLTRRKWLIENDLGAETVVEGAGVVGKTPIIHKQSDFSYESFAPLDTPLGRMSGHFVMEEVGTGAALEAKVGPFLLDGYGLGVEEEQHGLQPPSLRFDLAHSP